MTVAASTLDEWTFELIQHLCSVGQGETSFHDFKFGLSHPDGHTKLCCAFANSSGGFVVLGVKDGAPFEPIGIDPNPEISRLFGQRIHADPTIHFEAPKPIEVPGTNRLIYVFHVPRSQARPHLPTAADKRIFWKRTNTGCEQMSLEEIRAMFVDYEGRRRQLELLAAELFALRLDYQLLATITADGMPVIKPDATLLGNLLPDAYPLIAGDGEMLDLLMVIRRMVKVAAGEESLFLARTAAQTTWGSELFTAYILQMRTRAAQAIPIIDAALIRLRDKYGILIPLGYSEPPSDATSKILSEIRRESAETP